MPSRGVVWVQKMWYFCQNSKSGTLSSHLTAQPVLSLHVAEIKNAYQSQQCVLAAMALWVLWGRWSSLQWEEGSLL